MFTFSGMQIWQKTRPWCTSEDDKNRPAVASPTSKNVTVEGNYSTGGRNYPIITAMLKQANICKLFLLTTHIGHETYVDIPYRNTGQN
jgi:hypothetical protein